MGRNFSEFRGIRPKSRNSIRFLTTETVESNERKLELPSNTVSFELRLLETIDYFFQVKKYQFLKTTK